MNTIRDLLSDPNRLKIYNALVDVQLKEYSNFGFTGTTTRFFEHKTESYKNGRRKIYVYKKGLLFMETPYQDGNSFGFKSGDPKEVDEDTLTKYYKEITRNQFFEKQVTHIPTS